MRRSTLLGLTVCFLAVFGFGCRQPAWRVVNNSAPATNTVQTTSPNFAVTLPTVITPAAAVTTTATQTKTVSPQIAFLRRSLQRLADAKTFRAKIEVPTDNGLATGDIEFSRADGIHSTLHLPNTNTEMISTGDNKLYFRSGTSTWTAWSDLTGTAEGDAAAGLLRSALTADGQLADGHLKDSARVVATAKDPEGCSLYTVDQSDVVAPELLDICLNVDMPVRLAAHTERGLIIIRYRDFNKPVTIVAPKN